MTLPVLVPLQSKALFDQSKALDIKPVFYRLREESFVQRVMRKLGLRDAAQTLAAKFDVVEDEALLGETYAIWLSPAVYLPGYQMASLLDLMPCLKWAYSQYAGTDHLELPLFRERGVLVSNNGQLSSRRVAEMALALILAHAKRLHDHFALQRKRRWRSLPCDDLCHQTVGIIGTGSIGNELATLCRSIGMQVIGASRDPKKFGEEPAPYHKIVRLDGELESMLAQSDHVVLALPLNQQTKRLVGTKMLSHMKRTGSLINVARGAIVCEDELCGALSKGVLGAAYIDRPTKLPPSIWSPLYRTSNLRLTHYSAAMSTRVLEEAFNQFIEGLKRLVETGNPPNRVI